MSKTALEGLRIIDLSQAWAGPYATKLLGDMGAEIIKVEAARRMDSTRGLAKVPPGPQWGIYPNKEAGERPYNRAGYFNKYGRNKCGITLDLTSEKGKEVFKRLVKVSDVVVENFAAGVMTRLGLDYPVLRQVKPDIIMVCMPAMGMTGPEKDYVGYGVTIEQLAGLVSITGYLGDVPMKSGINYGDPIAGIAAAGYLLAALACHRRTGKGQLIDISQRETTATLIGDVIMDYSMNKRVQTPIGNRHPSMAPHGCYRCQGEDMWVTIAVGSDAEWKALCQVMGKPEMAQDARFADILSRHRNQDELDVIIGEWTKERDHYEVMQSLQKAGVMAGAVLNPQEVVEDPHLQARSFYEEVDHPEAGTYRYAGPSWKLSKTPGGIRMPAPCLGEHNDYVYREIIGMSEEEVAELAEEGIISNIPIEEAY